MDISISRAKLLLGVVLALLIYLPAVSPSSAAEQDSVKIQTLRQTGKQLLEIGYEQYQRQMYDNAKDTLERAAQYREYMSIADASKLDALLKKLNLQPIEEVEPPQQEITAEPEPVIEETQITQEEHPVIIEQTVPSGESAVNTEYIEFVPVEPADIYQNTQMPVSVEQTEIQPEFITPAVQQEQVEIYQPLQPAEPQRQFPASEGAKEDYIEVVKQKQRIQQSYTKAIVNEAIAKAKEYAEKEDFLKAKDEIARATGTIEKNRLLLGDADYAQYKASMQQLSDDIDARQTEVNRLKAEKAKTEAQAAQERLRTQQAADRQKRIQDLLTHSMEYQEQQRYEEALAQLETLLAIEPTNREASRGKQMLEDIINLRRQLEVKKEIGREEQNVLYDTQRSMIPHADLITYPRNWQDIIAKREPSMITGLSPVDNAVYEQLRTIVDLTALTPDTPFDEAIETIKAAVDPQLKIIVRWKDLEENAYIEPDTVIGMQGLAGIAIGKALRELLNTVSGGVANIDYAVEEGIITIATRESLPSNMVPHVYDITELVGRPANFQTDLQTGEDAVTSGETSSNVAVEEEEGTQQLSTATVMQMIQDTIAPMSWLINGGEGTISAHGKRLVINQTPQIHKQIQQLLMEDLRESLGQQVSLETRFLFVTENFLEDIGFGINNISINNQGKISNKLGSMIFDFDSFDNTAPGTTMVPGNLSDQLTSAAVHLVGGVTYGSVLDDLTVSFFLRATQAHRDAKVLTAPRVTVLSGESAYIRVVKEISYVSDYEFEDITTSGNNPVVRVVADPQTEVTTGGVVLNATPTITADKKYVILNIGTSYTKTDLDDFPVYSTQGDPYQIQLPARQVSAVQTRVSVPDGGTLLIGGQKLGAEVNKESGVPVISKMPLLGRLFSNRSKVKDQDVLLILVKPTIILQQEAEKEYFAPLE